MYIDEHGERGPPTAEELEWEMIIALARNPSKHRRTGGQGGGLGEAVSGVGWVGWGG